MIQITADTRRAVVTNKELLTKGSAGIQVQFTLSEDWAGLAKVAVFRQGDEGESVDCVLDSSLTCVVPPEILTTDDEVVFCGVYGSNGQGTIIIPTIWASLGVVRPGTEPNTPATAEPTPEIWAQILNVAQSAEGTANDAYTMAANAQGYIVEKIVTDAVDDFVENTVPTAIQGIEQAGETQAQAVEDKGAEVLDSIPQDYSDLAAEVDDLNRQLSDVEENQIPELKSAISEVTGTVLYQFLPGQISTSSAVGETLNIERGSFTNVCSAIIPVTANENIHVELTPRDNGATRWYCFTDSSYVILSKAGPGSDSVNEIITAPQNGYLIVNALSAYRHIAYDGVVDIADKINNINEDIYSITGTHNMVFEPGNISTSIAVGEIASLERSYLSNFGSAYIQVKKGYAVTIIGRPRDNGSSRYYMFLDNNLKVVSKAPSGSANVNETVFAPADGYAVVNLYTNEAHEATVGSFNVSGKVMELSGKVMELSGKVMEHDWKVSKMPGNILYNYGNLKLKTSALCPESCTWVGDTLVTAFPSDVEGTSSQTARIYIFTFGNGFAHDYTKRKWFTHDWGHLNTIDYSAVNDALITTNAGQGVVNAPDPNGNGHIYIFPKFSHFIENVEHDSTVNYEDYSITVDGVTYTPIDITLSHSADEWANDAKYQAVWDNNGISVEGEMDNKSIILVSGIYGDTENRIAKLRVCTLGATNGAFNGNITVNKTYQFLSADIMDTDFVQDMCLVNGTIYINSSETNTELWECVLDIESSTVNVIKYRRNMPKASGNRWRSGIAYKDGMFAVGFSSAGLWFENLPNH